MKKLFEVVVDQIRTKIVQTCAENSDEALDLVQDQVRSGVIELDKNNIVATDASDVWEVKPTEAEIKEVQDWALEAVASMGYSDEEFIYRTATKEDIEKTFAEWVTEGQEIPKFADSCDLWKALIITRKAQADPTAEQFDQICEVQDSVDKLLKIMVKDAPEDDRHASAMFLADHIAEWLAAHGYTVHYPTHTEGEGWSDTIGPKR